MACSDCNESRVSTGAWRRFDLKCIYCGARLIQQIPTVSNTNAEASQRRKVVLADWCRYGHSEAEIRTLAALSALAYEPVVKGR